MALVLVDRLLNGVRARTGTGPTRAVHPKPHTVFWWWEQICNLACDHCDIGRRTKSYRVQPALDMDDKRQVLRRLGDWLGPGYSLSFIAGEPFMHRDMIPVLGIASEHGAVTSVTTNATALSTRRRARQVVESGLRYMAVSLDSLDPEYHDRTRGRRGTWNQATKAIRHIREARGETGRDTPTIWVNSIIMRDNLDDLLRLTDWVREEGLEGHTFQPIATKDFFMAIESQGPRWFETSPHWPDTDRALAFVDALEERKAAGWPIRNSAEDFAHWRSYFRDPLTFQNAGSCENELSTVIVLHDGKVKMCPNTSETFGSILKDGLDEMWGSPAADRARQHVHECASQCKILACNKEDFYF